MSTDRKRQAICAELARLLREERTRKGVSMTSLAESAGLSQQMISYIERGMRIPGLDTLLRITDALEIDAPKLLNRAIQKASKQEA